MNFQKLLYPLSVNVAIVAFWTAVVGHNNANYFWTNYALGIATAINVCQVIRNAFDMLEKELDEVIRDSENENEKQTPRPRPITVSDLINCIRAIGKIDVKMIKTYNFAIPKKPELKPEPLMDNGWCNLDDANILCDKRRTFGENIDYYESNDEDTHDDKLFRKKRVVKRKVEEVLNEVEQEVLNEVEQDVDTKVDNEVDNEVETDVSNKCATNVETNVSNEVDAESAEGSNKVDEDGAEGSNKAETNVSNKVDTKDAEYVVVE